MSLFSYLSCVNPEVEKVAKKTNAITRIKNKALMRATCKMSVIIEQSTTVNYRVESVSRRRLAISA